MSMCVPLSRSAGQIWRGKRFPLARQITEAFPWTSAPAYLVRDDDRAYGHVFTSRGQSVSATARSFLDRHGKIGLRSVSSAHCAAGASIKW
jgi:hypothetical protein